MRPDRKIDWERLKALALGLGLPGVEETTSWGEPTLKAHGKLWVWWSPHEDAPVFKVPFEERDVLVEAEPETFFFTPHYKSHPLVLVRPEQLDLAWAKANLVRVWRAQAPKRVLKAYDEAVAGAPAAPGRRNAGHAEIGRDGSRDCHWAMSAEQSAVVSDRGRYVPQHQSAPQLRSAGHRG